MSNVWRLGPLGWRFLGALVLVVATGMVTMLAIWLVGTRLITADDLHLTPGWILLTGGVAMIAAAGVAIWLSHRISDPLRAAASMAMRFAEGNREVRLDESAPGELGQLAHSFNLVGEKVTQSERDRRNMAADIAHELRTPLAALQAGLEEVRDGYVPADPDTLARLHAQSSRLGRIVRDLADLAAAESNALALRVEAMDLMTAAHRAIDEVAPAFDGAGVDLEIGDTSPALIRADPDRVHQVLVNLLRNSASYCRPGDLTRVSVRTDSDGRGVLEVRDTGPGIPDVDLPRVFDRYWRGSGDCQAGSGLGLPLAKSLIERQGGSITVSSPHRRGTSVTIALPAPPPDDPELAGAPRPNWIDSRAL